MNKNQEQDQRELSHLRRVRTQLGTEDYDGIAEILMFLALDKGGQSV